MLTAHLPSGYVLARALRANTRVIMGAALLGAVAPDFDMLWFHFVDHKAFHHHHYWVHIPAFWAGVSLVLLPLIAIFKRAALAPALVFLAAIFLHLILDSLVGEIAWLWPVSRELYALFEVPATRSHWVWSFIFHWSFGAELAIWATATWLWLHRPRRWHLSALCASHWR